MKIAMLGGTFNPVHIGHLALADAVHGLLGYDKVVLIPTCLPPHKEPARGAGDQDRLAMLELAIADADFLTVDDCELVRGGISYTIDTIQYLKKKYADSLEGKIGLVIGQDLISGFLDWKDAEELARITDIIIASRPEDVRIAAGKSFTFPYPYLPLENNILPISSSAIRKDIRESKNWRYLVPVPVYRYIIEHKLYD